PAADMEMLWDRFEARRKSFLENRPVSAVDRWRADVYEASVAAAAGQPGIYRLPAPTGSGKTIASAAFGLRHAVEHGKGRVIVAVPFTTITEQNAGVYRQLLDPRDVGGSPVVLEHHTNVPVTEAGSGDPRERWRRLAAENWDAPFVVTTTVQLFESLFGRRPAQMRKVHRLANAVIVLDEVQALPADLLLPIVDGLKVLTERFGATVLLASATQPELWELSPLRATKPREVIADPAPLYRALGRVRYRWWTQPRPSLEQVADEVAAPSPTGNDQVLVIVNTIANAHQLHGLVTERVASGTPVFHLSTAMCSAHRGRVLHEVRDLLAAGRPVRLISTQLIEAGVDVDFPVVYRALAPADALQQAAGRANREGALGPKGGLVVVFDPADGSAPGAYKIPVEITAEVMGEEIADPDDLPALRSFYRQYLKHKQVTGSASRGRVVQENRHRLDFRAVSDGPLRDVGRSDARDTAKAFRMINDDTVPVVVRDEAAVGEIDEIITRLRTSPQPDLSLLRRLQPYLVTLRRRTRETADVAALCRPIVGELAEWLGAYDTATGIQLTADTADFVL
ncbi:CRISPR-associated helicase/endonuclease Cas3, partial [Frankia sp. EI5c]|uniref:CRISPR-associated helicase/endonuclease Cas3 n=1 Tax=Frankia sp. EI5c TaxID=683316 RepID=UPI001A7ECA49